MVKYFIRTYVDIGKDNQTFTEKEKVSLTAAQTDKKVGEKIHICYHDEKPVKPCKLKE